MAVTPEVGGAGAVVGSYGVSGAAGLSVGPGVGGRESSAAGSDTGPAGPGVVARSDPVGGPLGALVLVLGSDDGDGAADAADAVGPIGVSRLVGRSAGDRAWGSTAPAGARSRQMSAMEQSCRGHRRLGRCDRRAWDVGAHRGGGCRIRRCQRQVRGHGTTVDRTSTCGPEVGQSRQRAVTRWSCGPRSSRTRGPPRRLVDPSPMSASPGNRPHLLGRAGGWHGPFRRRGAFRPPASPGHRGGGSGWALAMPR